MKKTILTLLNAITFSLFISTILCVEYLGLRDFFYLLIISSAILGLFEVLKSLDERVSNLEDENKALKNTLGIDSVYTGELIKDLYDSDL